MRQPKVAPVKAKGGKAPAGKKRGLTGHVKKLGVVTVHSRKPGKTGTHHPHHVHHKAAPKKTPVKRKWSPGVDVDCCTAQALGTLLGLSDADVLALYWQTADDPDAGATIADTLRAATGHVSTLRSEELALRGSYLVRGRPLILGVSLREPHAIAVTPDGTWWSWGEPFDPCDWPDLLIEEAWAVQWQ